MTEESPSQRLAKAEPGLPPHATESDASEAAQDFRKLVPHTSPAQVAPDGGVDGETGAHNCTATALSGALAAAPDAELAAIRARLAAITPGPWALDTDSCDCQDGMCSHGEFPYQVVVPRALVYPTWANGEQKQHVHPRPACIVSEFGENATMADGEFIAHAPGDVAALLARAEAAEARADVVARVIMEVSPDAIQAAVRHSGVRLPAWAAALNEQPSVHRGAVVCLPREFDPEVERAAEAIYDAMRAGDPAGAHCPWVPGGNSDMQEEARRRARADIAARAAGSVAP